MPAPRPPRAGDGFVPGRAAPAKAGTPIPAATPPTGLTDAEARARRGALGANRLVEARPLARLRAALRAFLDPMALMLGTAAAVYLLMGETRDGIVLLVSMIPVLGVDVVLEARSRAALARLAERVAVPAVVVRGGVEKEVPTEEVVPGDLLVLREGSVVHADGVVLSAANLAIDESPLTGEAVPQGKRAAGEAPPDAAEAETRFYAGTAVASGQGLGLVEATGASTRYGRIGAMTAATTSGATPLQRRIRRVVRAFAFVALACAAGVGGLALLRGAPVGEAFLVGVSLAIAAVPEEFPLVFTLFLSLGAWRLAKSGVLARRLASVETLGSTTVVCVDKTGTLTHGRFALVDHAPLDDETSESTLLDASVLACEPHPQDPLERAVVEHAVEHGADAASLHRRWSLVRDHDFDPVGRHMSHVWRGERGEEWVVAKGALEGILDHCDVSATRRSAAEAAMAALASKGARVLAVAGRRSPEPSPPTARREDDERALALYGLLGFEDPVRREVPAAVGECRSAGIRVMLVTGDHALTARAVAVSAGIALDDAPVLSGADLDAMSPEALTEALATARVLARVRPEQKRAVVDALRRGGEVVAMTGDGINDAPALARADIGVSMGRGATEVAREAAGLVLLENDFGGLVAAVREGRTIFLDLQRAFLYLVAFHVPVVALSVAPLAVGLPPLLRPIHLVGFELVVHPVSALAFEGEPPPPDLMRHPPRDPASPMLARDDVLRSAATGLLVAAAAAIRYATSLDSGVEHARTVALAVVLLASVLLVWAERAIDRPWWSLPWPTRRRFWAVIVLVVAALPVLCAIPSTAAALGVTPVSASAWALSALYAVAAVVGRAPGAHPFRRSREAGTGTPPAA